MAFDQVPWQMPLFVILPKLSRRGPEKERGPEPAPEAATRGLTSRPQRACAGTSSVCRWHRTLYSASLWKLGCKWPETDKRWSPRLGEKREGSGLLGSCVEEMRACWGMSHG